MSLRSGVKHRFIEDGAEHVPSKKGGSMNATIGDKVAVIIEASANAPREATVIDVRDSATGHESYLVEWADNGHRQLVALGPGSRLEKR